MNQTHNGSFLQRVSHSSIDIPVTVVPIFSAVPSLQTQTLFIRVLVVKGRGQLLPCFEGR